MCVSGLWSDYFYNQPPDYTDFHKISCQMLGVSCQVTALKPDTCLILPYIKYNFILFEIRIYTCFFLSFAGLGWQGYF